MTSTINAITIEMLLTIIATVLSVVSIAANILFYQWSKHENERASDRHQDIQILSHETLTIINEKVNTLSSTSSITNKVLLDAHSALINNTLSKNPVMQNTLENVTLELKKQPAVWSSIEPQMQEVSDYITRISNIGKISAALANLQIEEIGVLYAIWLLAGTKQECAPDQIMKITKYKPQNIENALEKLKKNGLITNERNIMPELNESLNSLFDIDDVSTLVFSQRLDSLCERITRIRNDR